MSDEFCMNCSMLEDRLRIAEALLNEWDIRNEPPIKIATKSIKPIHVYPGDSIHCKAYIENSDEQETLSADIKDSLIVNTITIYKMTDSLGFKHVVAGFFGESK